MSVPFPVANARPSFSVLVGGYTDAGATGLLRLAATDGAFSDPVALAPFVNVSAGVPIPGTHCWWLVDERADRLILADSAHGWREIASAPSGGTGPCHLALHPSGRLLAVANYDSGSVGLLQLAPDGSPVGQTGRLQLTGSGPVPKRQEASHAHWVGFDPKGRLYIVDLGADCVLALPADAESGACGSPEVLYQAPPGSGPRQLAFDPPYRRAFLVSELASTLSVLHFDDNGRLLATQIVSTLPPSAQAESLGGAIALSEAGDRLWVSNRGDDSIAAFAVNDRGVTLIGHAASGGRSPRFLLPLRDRLLVAHEQAGGVTVLALDENGAPHPTPARAEAPGAAFMALLG
jgi:6-phosphogluconolactonase